MIRINDWAFKWKMSLILKVQNPPTKLSSVKKNYFVHYPPITFNKVPVKHVQSHKHLGLTLDLKLDFHKHILSILSKVNKLTAVSRKHFYQGILFKHSTRPL